MKKTIIDYLTVLLGTGVGRGVAFLNSIIIARTIGKEDFGRFSIFFVVMVLTWIFPQAFDSVFVRYAKTTENEKHKIEYLRVSFFLKLVYSLVAVMLAYPVAWMLAVICFKKPEMTALIVWAIISGVFQAFLMTIASIYQERENFDIFTFFYASYTISIFVALILLRFLPLWFTLYNVIAIHVFVSIVVGTASIVLLLKRKIKYIWPLDKECMLKSFNLGKWAFWSVVVAFAFSRTDTLFLPRYVSFDVIGVYGVAQQVTMLISVMAGSLSNVFLPKACASINSSEALRRYIKESMVIVAAIVAVILVLIFFTGSAIKILYGSQYLSGKGIVQILLCGWLFYILFLPFASLFYAFEDSRSRFLIDGLRFLMAVILLFFLVPRYKAIGAAWGMTIAHIISCFFGFWVLSIRVSRHNWS